MDVHFLAGFRGCNLRIHQQSRYDGLLRRILLLTLSANCPQKLISLGAVYIVKVIIDTAAGTGIDFRGAFPTADGNVRTHEIA